MKTSVDASELSVKYAAQDVFPAVTLHIVESSLPIYLKVYGQARLQAAGIAIYLVIYFIFVLIDIFYLKLSDCPKSQLWPPPVGKNMVLSMDIRVLPFL